MHDDFIKFRSLLLVLQSCGSFLGTRAQSVLHTGKSYLSPPWINQRNASKAIRKQAVANQSLADGWIVSTQLSCKMVKSSACVYIHEQSVCEIHDALV